VIKTQFNNDMLDQLMAVAKEHHAFMSSVNHSTLKGLGSAINPDCPPKNYKDARYLKDQQKWEATTNKKYLRFNDMKALAVVKPPTELH
jgi:hypothetical protein